MKGLLAGPLCYGQGEASEFFVTLSNDAGVLHYTSGAISYPGEFLVNAPDIVLSPEEFPELSAQLESSAQHAWPWTHYRS